MIDTNPTMWSIGLMTGTVLDGNIDVATLRTDGEQVLEFGPFALIPYPAGLLSLLQEALEAARDWQFDGPEPEIFEHAEVALTTAQSNAVLDFLGEHGISNSDIGIVGFHGQSVLHRAPKPGRRGQTRQLGDGNLMSRLLDIPVAYDFRSADIAAGGQGAPLAPAYHSALLGQSAVPGKSAVVNLGGVGNITWQSSSGELAAFDTGPANAPINDLMVANQQGVMDRDGLLAACGTIDEQRLSTLLTHPYFSKPYPKSLDRFDFTADMAQGMALEDAAALLTAFSAAAVAKAVELLQDDIQNLIVCGGGRHNPTLMRQLEIRSGLSVMAAEEVGWRGDATEAECFAFLAVRVMRDLPISFPSTTGVVAPMTGGKIVGLRDQAGR